MQAPVMEEQLDILRRIVERLKASAERDANSEIGSTYVDYANHLLAEIQATIRQYGAGGTRLG